MSLRKAINDKCKECIYDDSPGNGNWRQQVQGCTSPKCPLFPRRPVSKPRRGSETASQVPIKPISEENASEDSGNA